MRVPCENQKGSLDILNLNKQKMNKQQQTQVKGQQPQGKVKGLTPAVTVGAQGPQSRPGKTAAQMTVSGNSYNQQKKGSGRSAAEEGKVYNADLQDEVHLVDIKTGGGTQQAPKYDFRYLMDIVNQQDTLDCHLEQDAIISATMPHGQTSKSESGKANRQAVQKSQRDLILDQDEEEDEGFVGGMGSGKQFRAMQADRENFAPNLMEDARRERRLGYQEAPTDGIDYEVKEISSKEEELLRKARDLENEMRAIRQAKVEVVVRQFEQQLLKDASLEEKRYTEALRDKYDQQVNSIDAEKQAQLDAIGKMQKQLLEQIEFFKVVYGELETKKSELGSTHQACVQYLRREMSQAQREHKDKLLKHVSEKKEIFKNYISSQQQEHGGGSTGDFL